MAETNTGTTQYNYDAVGNLASFTQPNGVTHAYTYDTQNRLEAGARFRLTKAATLPLMIHWAGPFTGGFKVNLQPGFRFIAASDSAEHIRTVRLVPADLAAFEAGYVPPEYFKNPKYDGVSFVLSKTNIGKLLQPE